MKKSRRSIAGVQQRGLDPLRRHARPPRLQPASIRIDWFAGRDDEGGGAALDIDPVDVERAVRAGCAAVHWTTNAASMRKTHAARRYAQSGPMHGVPVKVRTSSGAIIAPQRAAWRRCSDSRVRAFANRRWRSYAGVAPAWAWRLRGRIARIGFSIQQLGGTWRGMAAALAGLLLQTPNGPATRSGGRTRPPLQPLIEAGPTDGWVHTAPADVSSACERGAFMRTNDIDRLTCHVLCSGKSGRGSGCGTAVQRQQRRTRPQPKARTG